MRGSLNLIFSIISLWEKQFYHYCCLACFKIRFACCYLFKLFKMARLGGLQFSKPIFDWESQDKLTELEQFKADCRILFDGPLSDLKDKQRAGLLVNLLG